MDAHALLIDYWGEKGEHGRMRCKISKIVPFKPLKVEQQTVYGYMHVSGPTRVLTLTHDRELYPTHLLVLLLLIIILMNKKGMSHREPNGMEQVELNRVSGISLSIFLELAFL